MKLLKNLHIENIILTILAMLIPWSIMFATPQLHIGYWGQVEGMIVFNHFSTAIISLLLLRIVILNKDIKKYFAHPLVFLPYNDRFLYNFFLLCFIDYLFLHFMALRN